MLRHSVLLGSPTGSQRRHSRSGGDGRSSPRDQWHTFWNAGDEPARILEIISPAGFERYFEELVDLGGSRQADPGALADLCARYELEVDPASIPGLLGRFDLRLPTEPT